METTRYRLKDILKIKNGRDHSQLEDGQFPVIGSGGVMRYANQYLYNGESVLLPRKGTLDNIQYINGSFWTVDTCYYTEIDTKIVNSYYLYRHLRSLDLSGFDSGASIPSMTSKCYYGIKIDLPNLNTQKRIADILSAYDDLIENNNRRIALLEKTAQELYKEWFVRFRFPGYETTKFENGIPENWRISTVKETFDIFDTKRIPLSSMDRDKMRKVYPYYGAAELMDYVDDYIFDGIYLLLGEDGSVITPAGKPILQYVWGKMWVNNHAHVLQGKSPYSTEYLHLMFGQMDITGIVTGAAQPKISQGRLFKKKTILPTNDLILRFDSLIQPMYKSIRQLIEANRNLAKQRDLLLPRLMSGKLEV